MTRSHRMSVQKRLRERKKAEAAELARVTPKNDERPAGGQVAERSDLEAYGVIRTFSDPQ
jgi:hypothetical protein